MSRAPLCLVSLGRPEAEVSGQLRDGLAKAAQAGFDGVLWRDEALPFFADPDTMVAAARDAGLRPIVQVDLTRWPIDHPLVEAHPALFALRRHAGGELVDPRRPAALSGEARARLQVAEAADALLPELVAGLGRAVEAGVAGFRLVEAGRIAPALLRRLIAELRAHHPDLAFIAGPPGLARPQAVALRDLGLDGLVSSYAWWDLRAAWLGEEFDELHDVAPLLAEVLPETVSDPDNSAVAGRALLAAAATANGLIAPLALVGAAPEAARQATALVERTRNLRGALRRLTGPASAVTALLRTAAGDLRQADAVTLVLINTGLEPQEAPLVAALQEAAGVAVALDPLPRLNGGEVRVIEATASRPVLLEQAPSVDNATAAPRLVVEDITPRVDGGDFPVKRVVGETVPITAKVFADGHEQLAAEVLWRALDEADWQRVRMAQLPNDGWEAAIPLTRMGRHEFVVEGWLDRFGGYRRDFKKKLDAGVAQPVDHAEGRVLVERARDRSDGALRDQLVDWVGRLAGDDQPDLLLSDELHALMDAADDRPHRLASAPQKIDAERLQARFSSWYELFPRSQTDDPHRHGTFADVEQRLPAIRAMGFDTLYFPPIHPIGRSNRKGPNNTLNAGPDDPGSPYAIGSADGGHSALHPELGGFDEFKHLIDAAHAHGLEIALDFAIQCSPDHPWLKEHPGWFDWRPDGSIKYAENPPKKYQDIVNVDFYQPDAMPGLWLALRDAVLFWIEHGVKTFRVDNPHTKPLPFWEWMIGEVRARHPDAIFLAEAFTRPGMMYRLAKIGFSQSYTYFTWRDRKDELTEYITELTTTAPKDFYRPHFFVNTPDINPLFLQSSGRPGFRIRAVLAATLSGLLGVYSGFELCEAAAVPGKEEYLDSEKYIVKPRDWQAPGNIIADITLLNRLRRSHPALQTHLNTRFLSVANGNILYYAKPSADGADMILVMVSLDPHHAQGGTFEVPLWEFGIPDDGSIGVEDLVSGGRFRWWGKTQNISLDPENPYRIWRIAPGADA